MNLLMDKNYSRLHIEENEMDRASDMFWRKIHVGFWEESGMKSDSRNS